jgi:hypothetical protein
MRTKRSPIHHANQRAGVGHGAGKDDGVVGRRDPDTLLIRQQLADHRLQCSGIHADDDIEGGAAAPLIEQHDVGRADALPEHMDLGRAQQQEVDLSDTGTPLFRRRHSGGCWGPVCLPVGLLRRCSARVFRIAQQDALDRTGRPDDRRFADAHLYGRGDIDAVAGRGRRHRSGGTQHRIDGLGARLRCPCRDLGRRDCRDLQRRCRLRSSGGRCQGTDTERQERAVRDTPFSSWAGAMVGAHELSLGVS